MTLDELSTIAGRVSDLYAERCDIHRDDDWFLLKLQEELGELTQVHLKLTGRGRIRPDVDLQQARADEAADVLCQLMLYCRRFGIDPEAAVRDKWLTHLPPDPATAVSD